MDGLDRLARIYRSWLILSPLILVTGVVMGLAIGGAAAVGAGIGGAAFMLGLALFGRSRLAKIRALRESAAPHGAGQPESHKG